MGVPLFNITKRVINNKEVRCYIIPIWEWRGKVARLKYALRLRAKFGYKNAQLVRQLKLIKERHLAKDKKIIKLQSQVNYYKRTMKPRIDNKINEIDLLIETLTL